ncbi:hypothetical protein H0H92_001009 [Tricholoma furcatifolium]|nr:hypothetical protein H0H92_001009 [Tricholoma furcatifolium]
MDLIEASLPSQLPHPSASDASIFEDVFSDEYATPLLSKHPKPSSVLEVLESLILRDHNEEAYEFLSEIQSSGIEIPRSMMYAHAALRVLSSPDLSEEEVLSRFSFWFKNIPFAHENDKTTSWRGFESLNRRIFEHLRPTVTLAIEYSLIMASRGYAELIGLKAVPFISRFASISITTRFLEDFAEADFSYLYSLDPKLKEASAPALEEHKLDRKQRMVNVIQGAAITTLAKWGDLESALSLLPAPTDPIKLPSLTYQFLLSRLFTIPGDRFLEDIERIKDVLKDLPTESTTTPETLTSASDKADLQVLQDEMLLIGETMAVQLQDLIDRISHSVLSERDLAPFFADYFALDRTIAITRLRRLALRRNRLTGGIFLYAEMSHYLRNGDHLLLLQTFFEHFYADDFPKTHVRNVIRSLQAEVDVYGGVIYDRRFMKQSRCFVKLWPTRGHLDLMWLALARSTPDNKTLALFYRNFIEYQKRIRSPLANATLLHLSPREEFPVGTAVFTTFMTRLLEAKAYADGSEILQSMAEIGIPTTIHHMTLLATSFVKADNIERALMVVDALEKAHPVTDPKPMQNFLTHQTGARPTSGLPVPDVLFYATVMDAMVKAQALQEAIFIMRLFYNRFVYTPGVHAFTDACLHNLASLKRTVDAQRVNAYRALRETPHHSIPVVYIKESRLSARTQPPT